MTIAETPAGAPGGLAARLLLVPLGSAAGCLLVLALGWTSGTVPGEVLLDAAVRLLSGLAALLLLACLARAVGPRIMRATAESTAPKAKT